MQLAFVQSAAYRVKNNKGEEVLLVQQGAEWNGMEELRDPKGRALVIARNLSYAGFFENFLRPDDGGTMTIVMGDKGLIAELTPIPQGAAVGAGSAAP